MRKIVDILETETNALIVLLGPTPLTTDKEAFREYDRALSKLARDRRIPFVSMQEIIMSKPDWDKISIQISEIQAQKVTGQWQKRY